MLVVSGPVDWRQACYWEARHMARCGWSLVRIVHELTTGELRGAWRRLPPRERVAILSMAQLRRSA